MTSSLVSTTMVMRSRDEVFTLYSLLVKKLNQIMGALKLLFLNPKKHFLDGKLIKVKNIYSQ
ncbi:hypothetical protein [Bartonella raoultii]|uniref:hypothetical protein n=1 Tax=Bartonella raoultii TaxID=1457020 RepID=UPI001ABA3FE2|nr:hypothetical protein [Bartonella raoultii]